MDDMDVSIVDQEPSFANGALHNLTPDSFLNPNQNNNSANGMDEPQPPVKRRPGRPKGSGKKHVTDGSAPPAQKPKTNNGQNPITGKRPVGRPRRDGLPAGSVGSRARKKDTAGGTSASTQASGTQSISAPVIAPTPGIPPSISAPVPRPTVIEHDDWAELSRTNPQSFLASLLVALSAMTYPQSSSSVKEAFKSHLNSLAPTTSPIPTLYSILKTFWLPTSPAYFSLTASSSTARTPPDHRFLYWDPQPLVFNGIACPTCSSPLTNHGRIKSGPIKVYDIERPFFIIGCEYVCGSRMCIEQAGSEGRKFASTDPSIWRALPNKLKEEFPARLLSNDQDMGTGPNVWNWQPRGVSKVLWNMVLGSLRAGLKKDVILQLLHDIHNGVPEEPEEKPSEQDELEVEDYLHQSFAMNQAGDAFIHPNEPVHVPQQSVPAVITDAYGDAWKANTAAVGPNSTVTPSPALTNSELVYPPASDVDMADMHSSNVSSSAVSPSQNTNPATNNPPPYGVYTAAPSFPSYSLSAGFPANSPAQAPEVPNSISQIMSSSSSTPVINNASTPVTTNGNELKRPYPFANSSETQVYHSAASMDEVARKQRSPRHCSKCGSPECKGKGGRAYCTNPCKDCGKLECKGRNSRRPDKPCTEGWD
ncbi:hypothetical protein D9758_003864 [Tetrapyrgos nigripes]|uniref:Uncharacterized protein n=1 Tax=Tetrapyrgos nigripes TaxID=182062 RepID=A0A8H5GLK9_9AGAR|nr:hypothetical protein D9758_003864 [Tetrapyrgos nigripes]